MIVQERSPLKEATPRPDWDNRFKVGDVVRTIGGGDTYNRGKVVEVAGKEKYYWVDYGWRFPALIREESLEPFDEKDPFSEPPRSFSPPLLPFFT